MVNRSEERDVKIPELKQFSCPESDGDSESNEEMVVPIYGKGKSGAFSMLAGVGRFVFVYQNQRFSSELRRVSLLLLFLNYVRFPNVKVKAIRYI